MHTLECMSEERKGYFTWESLAALFTERTGEHVFYKTVYNSCKTAGWRQVCERYVPCLNAEDVARRLEWAKQHLDYTWTGTENLRYPNVLNRKVGWVDIDEKWWDMLRKRAVNVHPGQQRQTRVPAKSKRFVQKVMGLCAPLHDHAATSTDDSECIGARAKRLRSEEANITNEGTCTTTTVRWTGSCSTR